MADHPKNIGKYSVTRPLGKGAMGMVYEGFDPVIQRKVAIKTILAEYLDAAEMEEAVARFKREAQAGGRLMHPGIVGVYEYGNDADMAFIVMEYVEGQELKRVLSTGMRYEVIEIFEIMKQLLTALDYSHKQGVIHRDIKPANLMVLTGNKVKIMDFGIARLESSNLTQVGTVVGTPTHMAPEQLMGLPADGRCDLWASGVILYELLTGASPFIAETPAAVMHNVLQSDPAPPSRVRAGLPRGFDGVVARALAKKPDERFQTAREFQAGLLMALQGKDITATMTLKTQNVTMRVPEPVPVLAISPEALAEIERSLSRHLGPLAKVLIRKSRAETTDFDAFFESLAEQIPDADEQRAFLKKVAGLKPARKSGAAPAAPPPPEAPKPAAPATGFTPEVLAEAEKRLASYVGPLARLLIKEAAGKSGNLKELYSQLAAHIDSEDERRDFLASLRR